MLLGVSGVGGRHDFLDQCGSKPGPENTNDKVILARVRNLFHEVVSSNSGYSQKHGHKTRVDSSPKSSRSTLFLSSSFEGLVTDWNRRRLSEIKLRGKPNEINCSATAASVCTSAGEETNSRSFLMSTGVPLASARIEQKSLRIWVLCG